MDARQPPDAPRSGLHRPHPPPSTLDAALREAAVRWPDRPAVEAPAARWRYAELDAAVDAAAAGLGRRGARAGHLIAAALGHDAAHAALPFVASRLGAAALLLPAAQPEKAWRRLLSHATPDLLLADDAHTSRLAAAAGRGVDVAGWRLPAPAAGPAAYERPAPTRGDEATVLLLATSGTSGRPKLVRLTERGILHAAAGYRVALSLGPAERSLVVMPLSYVGPLTAQTALMPLVGGCLVVAADTSPGWAAARLADGDITHLDAVPAWLARLAPRAPTAPGWRHLVYGGAPTPADVVAELAARQPQLALLDAWGLTETHGPVAARRADRDPGAGLRPWPGVSVRAVDDAGTGAAGHGELQVAGPTVTPGYLGDPQATAEAFAPDGWLRTGDVGQVDALGAVRLLDRAKDVVLRGGASVASAEVEAALRTVAGVADAAVVAVPDDVAGEAVAAVVVPVAGAQVTAGALRTRVRERLGAPAVPRVIAWRGELPRGATGKVDKSALRDELCHTSARPRDRPER